MGDHLIMSKKERERKVILSRCKEGNISLVHAAQLMQVSYRQAKRLKQRYVKEGDPGLLHRSRGRAGRSRYSAEVRQKCLLAYEEEYRGFGPTFTSEKLKEREGVRVEAETLRLWLKAAGLWKRQRKRSEHRQRRPRRECFGELLQIDGSFHEWFGEGRGYGCLMRAIDDATGVRLAVMAEQETLQALLELLWGWVTRYGIPEAVYVDLKTLYVSPQRLRQRGEEVAEPGGGHQFERLCQRLGIRIIHAYSPQAKGRVERSHQVDQDRLVKEIKLRGLTAMEEVNTFMESEYTPGLNRRFAVEPLDSRDRHRPSPSPQKLNQMLCWEYQRQVRHDWTFSFEGQHYQIPSRHVREVRPQQAVTIRRHLDGTQSVWRGGKCLQVFPIDQREKKVKEKLPYTSLGRSQLSKTNKAKSPWSTFNPHWLNPPQKNLYPDPLGR